MKFSGIIFDFNGVLWWDNSLQEQAWRQFIHEQFGISLTSEEMAVQVHGRNNQNTFEYLIRANLETGEVRQLSEQKERIYRGLCLAQGDEFKLSPGAEGLLDGLAAHKIPRTIATASGEENMDFFFEHLYLDRWFARAQIVYDDGSSPGKPDPEIYLQAAKELGLNPMDCVVVEDSISGIQSAQSAGIGHIIALGSVDQQARLGGLDGVDQVVDNLGNLDLKKVFL